MYRRVLKPLLFRLDPEHAHRIATGALDVAASVPPVRGLLTRATSPGGADLSLEVFGLRFPNPVGLAAGFDKNARHAAALQLLGFGFIEIGSITALPARGNQRPRLFRLPEEEALVNRMGLNNDGCDAIARQLARIRTAVTVPLFANVALTPGRELDIDGAIEDYAMSARRVKSLVDAIVLNVSCPNSGDGRTFEDPALLRRLLARIREIVPRGERPLVAKLSTDLARGILLEAVDAASEIADGIALSNTTIDRSMLRTSPERLRGVGAGGLSGSPLRTRAIDAVRIAAERTGGRCPIIGIGGIANGADARSFLEAGATLVELYTGLVYGGPLVVRRIREELGRTPAARAATSPPRARTAR